jgi:hypothetical protein
MNYGKCEICDERWLLSWRSSCPKCFPNKSEPESILQEANRIVNGDRGEAYGHPFDDFSKTATLFNTITGRDLIAEDVATLLLCVKLSRESNKRKRDNRVDAAGYLLCLDKIIERRSADRAADDKLELL